MASYRNKIVISAGVTSVIFYLGSAQVLATDPKFIAKPDTKFIEKIVREYLLKNPKIVIDAIESHRRNLAAKERLAIRQTIKARRQDLRHDPYSVVGGNLSGDVTVVEFFDYRCGVCKRVHPIVNQLVKRDGKIRRVYKEWPILGPQSVFASRAAIAARKQGDDKYLELHNRMMAAKQALTSDTVIKMAASVGLNPAQLRRDMSAPEIDKILQRNHRLAEVLKLNGTPSFLIGDTLLRGARDADTMLRLVMAARKKS